MVPRSTTTGKEATKANAKTTIGLDFDRILADWCTAFHRRWDALLTQLEGHDQEVIRWITIRFLRKLSLEAPVIVGFVFACVLLHLLNMTIAPGISRWLGIRDAFHLLHPMQYVRLITHIFGHENMTHLRGNMTHILMVGPSAEEIFGSQNIVWIMLAVAISSGFGHILFGPTNTSQIGASGVAFALILVNSLVSAEMGRIPISFVLTACLWTSDEMWKMLFAGDQIAHSAHLIGAIVGTAAGYYIQSGKTAEIASRGTEWNLIAKWKPKTN